jgi:perosamine synthetase
MISVYDPIIGQDEIDLVVTALKNGEISGAFGKFIPEFEEKFASYVDCKYGVAVSSGTTALHLAAAAIDIKAGDEVLVSASTNIASALGVYHLGGTVIPVDSEQTTWNLDLDLLEKLITAKTKAIVVVHLFGHPVDMERVCAIAKKHKLLVIEDCAESHGATCREKKTGSFGEMGCFSFYANKILTTGEGGMITTNNEALATKLRLLRNLAFGTPRFFHEVPAYNFRMTGYQAAMGVAQIKKLSHVIQEKRRVAHTYNQYLKEVHGIQTPAELDWARNVYWMYAIRITSSFPISRDELCKFLHSQGIDTRTFFCPMNQQPFIKSRLDRDVECPVADRLWQEGLYLPSTYTLDESTIKHVVEVIKKAVL